MPQQLIYTSAPRLLTPGRSGFGTVAKSAAMRDALSLRLEQISYFDHRALAGGRHKVIYAYRLIEIRGARYHVLSRLQDTGLDFTNRTNFIAHHLVFSPEEIRELPLPPDIFREWSGWAASWTQEPRLLTDEAWKSLKDVGSQSHTPAHTWERVTDDAANALGLLDCSAPIQADGIDEKDLLALLSESLALLEVREPDSDYRTAAWRFTFTTALQDQDQVADFRWRFVHSGSPAYARLAASGRSPLPLKNVRPKSPTDEALKFAREGPKPLRIALESDNVKIQEGETLVLRVEIDGVPLPRRIQWFECARGGSMRQPIPNQNSVELRLEKLGRGVHRYCVEIANTRETKTSPVVKVEVETQPSRGDPRGGSLSEPKDPAGDSPLSTAADHARDYHVQQDERRRKDERRKRQKKILLVGGSVLAVAAVAGFVFSPPGKKIMSSQSHKPGVTNAPPATASDNSESVAAQPGATNPPGNIATANVQAATNSVASSNSPPEPVFGDTNTKKAEGKATNTVPTNPQAKK